MNVSTVQQKIAQIASKHQHVQTISQYLTDEWVKEAFRRTRKTGAAGVDGKTSKDFEENFDKNITDLIDLCKSGRYRAPSARRVYIPKGNGENRPLGIPTFSDKVLQRAVLMLLEPIFEPMFYGSSYGFRPGKSAHDCIKDLRESLHTSGGCHVIDVDIRKFFDTIPRQLMREQVEQRVRDGVITRIIAKWLHAGIMENGNVSYSDLGTPQGGVLSPFLANVFLHYVLDEWFHETATKHLRGKAEIFRFADDFVIVCRTRDDAERLLKALHGRLGKYGLDLHPTKTRLVDFRKPREGKSESFDFLGFTFYWGKSRRKKRIVRVKTMGERVTRTMSRLNLLCRAIRHWPITDQWARINRALRGHYNYYGVSFNQRGVWRIRYFATFIWQKWLSRRSQKRHMGWGKFRKLLLRYPLAQPKRMVALW